MVANYAKYNSFVDNIERFSIFNELLPKRNYPLFRAILKRLVTFINDSYTSRRKILRRKIKEDDQPEPGRWYNAGLERTCKMLEERGYTIIDEDMGVDYKSPVRHFTK